MKYPRITVQLSGTDGNAFNIMAIVRRAMRNAGVGGDEIDMFTQEATSADYDHLLQTCMEWVDVR